MKKWQLCSVLLAVGVFFALHAFAGVRKVGKLESVGQVPDVGSALAGLNATSLVSFASYQNPVHHVFLVSGFTSERAITRFATAAGLRPPASASETPSSMMPDAFARVSRALNSALPEIATAFTSDDLQFSGELRDASLCEIRHHRPSGAFTAVVVRGRD